MKDKIQFIDEVLERLEDTAHGVDSKDLSTARKYLKEIEPFALLRLPEMPEKIILQTLGEVTVVQKVDENGRSRYYTTTKPPVETKEWSEVPSGLIGLTNFIEGKADYNIRTRAGITVDWNEAPEWANYHAVDEDGRGWWYRDKPIAHSSFWGARVSDTQPKVNRLFELNGTYWYQTLTKRP